MYYNLLHNKMHADSETTIEISDSDKKLSKLCVNEVLDSQSHCGINNNGGETYGVSKWQLYNSMKWDNLDECDSDGDFLHLNDDSNPLTFPRTVDNFSSLNDDSGLGSDSQFGRNYFLQDKEEYEELRQLHNEHENLGNETATLDGINELIRKFSTIEFLRRKENLRKSQEAASDSSPSCSSETQSQKKSSLLTKGQAADEKFARKIKHSWKDMDSSQDESDSDSEQEKIKDMELLKILLSHALGKERQDSKKRGDDILTSSKATIVQEEVVTSSFDEDKDNEDMTNAVQEENETSFDFYKIFDAYEIDYPHSFHDWMIDGVLLNDVPGSKEMIEGSNSFL